MSNYNQRAADAAYQVISKMDDDTAHMFSRMVVHDLLYADLDNNRRTVHAFADEILKSIQKDVSKALEGKGKRAEPIQQLVDTISKADWNEQNWVRDEGRFSRYKGPKKPPKSGGQKYKAETYRNSKTGQRAVVLRDRRTGEGFNVTGALAMDDPKKAGDAASTFAQRWHEQGKAGTNEQTYNRIAEGSRLMAQVGGATGSSSLVLAGQVGQMAGQMGPSAEQVLGPSMRKTAYRYRGTERPVDQQLQRETVRRISSHLAYEKIAPDRLTPEDRTELSRMSAMSYLQQRLPNKKLTELQRQSGKMPPSEGVIINADGKIITQAVGYQEDHFLPFNLKNLKGLQGGSYVRTRSSGGLTTEDIYTGLMSGARSVTVVSRSGVFTLDFEDDFRGERRYSDKARQMIGRYEQILNTVQSETVSRRSLEPEEKILIRDQVEEEFSFLADTWEGRQQIEATIKDRERAFATATHLTTDELKSINELAKEAAKNPQMRTGSAVGPGERTGGVGGRPTREPKNEEDRYRQIRAELISNAMDAKAAKHYRLDGEGYEVALNALAEQYPYYIANLRVQTRREDIPISRETDKGYVSPGAIRPNAVKTGYFGLNEGKGSDTSGKRSAATDNYAKPKDRVSVKTEEESSKTTATPGSTDKTKPNTARPVKTEEKVAAAKSKNEASEALVQASRKAIASGLDKEDLEGFKTLYDFSRVTGADDMERKEKQLEFANKPANRQELLREVELLRDRYAAAGKDDEVHRATAAQLDEHLKVFRINDARANLNPFNQANYTASPPNPFRFDDVAPGKSQEEYAAQYAQLTKGNIAEANDDDLRKVAQLTLTLASIYQDIANGQFDEGRATTVLARTNRSPEDTAKDINRMSHLAEQAQLGKPELAKSEYDKTMDIAVRTEKARAVLQNYKLQVRAIEDAQSDKESASTTPKSTGFSIRAVNNEERTPKREAKARELALTDITTLRHEIERQVKNGDADGSDLIAIDEMENAATNVAIRGEPFESQADAFHEAWNNLSSQNQIRANRFLGGTPWDSWRER